MKPLLHIVLLSLLSTLVLLGCNGIAPAQIVTYSVNGDAYSPDQGPFFFEGYFTSDGSQFFQWSVEPLPGIVMPPREFGLIGPMAGNASASSMSASSYGPCSIPFSIQVTDPSPFASGGAIPAADGSISLNNEVCTFDSATITVVSPLAWAQPVDGSWEQASSWSPALVPLTVSDVNFNTGSTTPYTVTLGGNNDSANNLNVKGDIVGIATSGKTLALAGDLNIVPGYSGTPGALTICADSSGNGTVSVAQGVNIAGSCQLSGNATIIGDVHNSGTVAPGTSRTPGALYIGGNYTQATSGSLNVRVNGTSASANFDTLQVTGNSTLAGTLNITTPGSSAAPGNLPYNDVYTILGTSGSISGKFNGGAAAIQTTFVNGGRTSGVFDVNYGTNAVALGNFHQVYVVSYGISFPSSLLDVGLNGGAAATSVSQAFSNVAGVVDNVPIGLSSSASFITNENALDDGINNVGAEVHPGDLAIFFINTHGSTDPSGGSDLQLSNVDSELMTPSHLAGDFAGSQWAGVNKLFILDSCDAAGLWAGLAGIPQFLSSLDHSAIIAASAANQNAYFDPLPSFLDSSSGEGYLAIALQQVLSNMNGQDINFQNLFSQLQTAVSNDTIDAYSNDTESESQTPTDSPGGVTETLWGEDTPDFSLDLVGFTAVPEPNFGILSIFVALLCTLYRPARRAVHHSIPENQPFLACSRNIMSCFANSFSS